jgi:hypothetical protein
MQSFDFVEDNGDYEGSEYLEEEDNDQEQDENNMEGEYIDISDAST